MRTKIIITTMLFGAALSAQSSIFTFNFNTIVTGSTPSGSSIATMTVADSGANQVLITLNHNTTSAAGQFITELWFNISPYQSPVQTNQSPANKFNGGLVASQNGVGSAGVDFDLQQSFQTSNAGGGVNRLKPGEAISFNLSGTGLDAADFVSLSQGNRTDVYAMIHLQGIPGGQSVKLGSVVPEPASLAALSLGAFALIRRKRK